ncbi:MAG: sugar transferase [Thermoleophilia bacterium]
MYKKFGKRLFDILLSVFAGLVLSPFLAIIALFIGIFNRGPVIFKQQRIGRYAEQFIYYKFRSMPVDTSERPSDQLPEIELPMIGKFIRRTNIDELPQLYNILKGDMSFVGPRPSLTSQYPLIEMRLNDGSLKCRPGLTGLAQVNSFTGMTAAQKATLDAEYCKKITAFKDLSILVRTFIYMLKPPPVY